jgi:hypothetical protein
MLIGRAYHRQGNLASIIRPRHSHTSLGIRACPAMELSGRAGVRRVDPIQSGGVTMRKKFGIAVVVGLRAAPVAVHAQGIFGGMERVVRQKEMPPLDRLVGSLAVPLGAQWAARQWGALGINPRPRYEHRSAYYHHRHYRHYHRH